MIELFNNISYEEIFALISCCFMVYGCFLLITSSIGMLRMPDIYTKMHALSISDSMGVPLILIGAAIKFGNCTTSYKLIFLLIIIYIVNPLSTYSLTQAAIYKAITPKGTRR